MFNNNQFARTVRLNLDVDVNVHILRAAQKEMNQPFGVATGRVRAALRNAVLESMSGMVLRLSPEGVVTIGCAGDEGFSLGDTGVVDASLIFGNSSPLARSED